ncbi:RX21 protein, partial [Acromyrmex charruanus]
MDFAPAKASHKKFVCVACSNMFLLPPIIAPTHSNTLVRERTVVGTCWSTLNSKMTPEGYTRVYVGGLNESIKKEDLQMEFEKYGKLNKVWVAFNPPGFAFIEFFNMNEAELACCNMNGMEIMGAKLRVEISRGRGRGGGRGGGAGGFRGNRGVGSRDFGSRGGTTAGYRGSTYADYGGSYYTGRGGASRGRGRYGEDYMYNRSSGYVTRDGYTQDVYGGSSGDTGADYYTGKDTSTARYRSRSPAGRGRY